ncbi:MAG TPA: tRNA (adenosine(37)-N6)-threonylcarbamoyltransferase complex dimerization subunit type 1 TsaB [Micropepsaceae bacterium]|nr:tRNA (adenosine(37)-N6)-threonylcarbamoyltransferase complex dimerization subunit type 1 TsaB [Micropepsaceae bacterium]
MILAVDTALGACSAALVAEGRALAHEHLLMVRGHAEALAPMVDALMRGAGVPFAALDRIAVTTGPGTFTGQRVGLAFARALGLGLKRPVIGVTTLDVMAQEALEKYADMAWSLVAADAKRGEIYLGARSARNGALMNPELIPLEAIVKRIGGLAREHGAIVLAGTAADAAKFLLDQAGLQSVDSLVRQPDAMFVARLAMDAPDGPPPKPLYLRAPDAKLPGVVS